jgi:P27 family predicted phage terminase small subunit
MRGRKQKPNEIKEAQGTLQPCRVKKDLIKPTIELNVHAPEELNEWGAALYEKIMTEYSRIGLVSVLDTGSLLILCNEFGTYCEADDVVKAKGMEVEEEIYNQKGEISGTRTILNPMLKARNDAFKNYKSMCTEFGLSPSSRATLSVPEKQQTDEIGELLS